MKAAHSKAISIFLWVLSFAPLVGHAQKASAFLPKDPGEAINSPFNELNPILSDDGLTIYFVRANHPLNRFGADQTQDVWLSKRASSDAPWQPATRMSDAINRAKFNSLYAVLDSGRTFVIKGRYTRRKAHLYKRGVSTVHLGTDSTYSLPKRLKIPRYDRLNKGHASTLSIHPDGSLLAAGINRNFESYKQKLYWSAKKPNGKWRKLKRIRFPRRKGSVEAPVWSLDKRAIYFAAERKGGMGEMDIYVIRRMDSTNTNKWTSPERLSDTINSPGWEHFFRQQPGGLYEAFVTTQNSRGGTDIRIRKKYEPRPYLDVRITFVDQRTGRALAPGYAPLLRVILDSQGVRSIPYSPDSVYKVPLRKQAFFTAELPYFTSDTVLVDARELEEYDTLSRVVQVLPFPYVDVALRLVSTNPAKPYKLEKLRAVTANGKAVEEPVYDYEKAIVRFRLPHSMKHRIDVKSEKYATLPLMVDLSEVTEYRKVDTLLQARPEEIILPLITLSGTVNDKKTGKPLNNRRPFGLLVNDTLRANEWADTLQPGKYSITLDPGRTYVIGAQRKGYAPIYELLDFTAQKAGAKVSKDLTVVPLEVGQSIKINNILFETGKANLKPSSFPELNRLSDFLNDYDIKAEIAGHTDNVGKPDANLKLSNERAKTVADYLINKGVDKQKLTFKGYGQTKPVASNKTTQGKAENRRVEFTVLDIVFDE
jgi:outer membrane protein OmpA-like peptidoglycan-associated protein